jgi:CIC family chloride channel protein
VTIAVLTAVVTASTIVRIKFGYSFSTWRFHLRGLPLRGGFDVGWVRELKSGNLLRADAKTVDVGMPVARLRGDLAGGRITHVFTVDSEGRFQGTIEAALLFDPDVETAQATLVAADISSGKDNFLLPNDDIATALERFDALKVEVLPVVNSATERKLVGYLTEALALRRYSEALERRRGEDLGMPSK